MSPSRLFAAPWRATLLAVVFVAAAIPVAQAADPENSERPYVVVLKNRSANAKAVVQDHSRRFGVKVRTVYDDGLRGYAGLIKDNEAKKLARESGVVIAPDTEVQASAEAVGSPEDLTTSPYYSALPAGWGWGLDRIDQHPSLVANPEKNKYHYTETGAGVTAYVIDSGVNTNHQEFDRNRATAGFDAFRPSSDPQWGRDCNGHGTHVAGILGGRTFGVAKDVSIVSVRVLDCNGSGSVSNVVAGINYVTGRRNAAKDKPVVANMSLGGSANSALDQAVLNSIAAGVTYSIAAGNGNIFGNGQDACNVSPARVKAALTVGATDTADQRTTWSNYGSCVDVYAPGNNIVSSYGGTGSTTSTWKPLSGTSMAAPAVGGVAALLLQIDGKASPAQVSQTIAYLGTVNAVNGTNTAGAKLLYAPYTTDDIGNAANKLDEPASSPPPPPPPSCFLICF
jgi:subtilisin family serine protease